MCLTADDRLVLLHDPLLVLGTTLDGWADDHTAKEIESGLLRDSAGRPTSEHPLSLDTFARMIPDHVRVQLEVKAHADPGLARRTAEALCDWLRHEPLRERVELISFHSEACAVAAGAGLPARLVIWADYAPEALAEWCLQTGVGGLSVEHFLLSGRLVDVLRRAGLSINAGTVNHLDVLERVLRFDPDAIGTDRPHELRAEAEAEAEAAPVRSAIGSAALDERALRA